MRTSERIHCPSCDADCRVSYQPVDSPEHRVLFCPFCGEELEADEMSWEENEE